MDLLNTYSAMKEGLLSLEEAAAHLKMTPESLNLRVLRWGDRLPTVLAALDAIANEDASRPEIAEALGCSIRQVNHLMESWGVKRPLKEYKITRTASKVKWELLKSAAIDVIGGSELNQCAINAHQSPRQLRRHVAKLLDEHYGMVYKDLQSLPPARRRRLADEIETAEGLEYSKRAILKQISDGEKSLKDEAIARLKAKRKK